MSAETLAPVTRIPRRYILASILQSAPAIVGLAIAALISSSRLGAWPGSAIWFIVGPLILLRLVSPVYQWLSTHFRIDQDRLVLRTGLVHRRVRSASWGSVGTIDIQSPWAFRLFGLARVSILQGGEETSRIVLPAIRAEERALLEQHGGHAFAGSREVEAAHEDESEPEATTIYRARLGDLVVAAFTQGHVAVGAVAVVVASIDLLDSFGLLDLTRSLAPTARVAAATLLVIVAVVGGCAVSVLRYAGFTADALPGGGIRLRYGLIDEHERIIDPGREVGIVLRRNVIETLTGRVRLTLLTTDSATGWGSNLVLPSLPDGVVRSILAGPLAARAPKTAPSAASSRGTVRLLLQLLLTIGPPLAAVTVLLVGLDTAPWVAVLCGIVLVVITVRIGRHATSRIVVRAEQRRIEHRASFVGDRVTALDAGAVHVVSRVQLGALSLVRVHYYAGMPRVATAIRDTAAQWEALTEVLHAPAADAAHSHRRRGVPQ